MLGTLLAVSSRALLASCAQLGLDTDAMLEGIAITRSDLEDPDARISMDDASTLWRRAYQLSRDPVLSLHAAEALPMGAYRTIDFLAWNAPTFGDALTQVSRYFPIINSLVRMPIRDLGSEYEMGVVAPSRPEILSRPYVEYTFAAAFLRTRIVTGGALALRRIEFAFAKPDDITEHERIFECPVQFDAPAHRMVVRREMWQRVNERAQPDLFAVLRSHAETVLDQVPNEAPELLEVRRSISEQLRGGDPSLEAVAKNLATTPRTLQRRLKAHGVRYSQLLDSMRAGTAKGYLTDAKVSVTEAAYLLGFSEQSAFSRAFKRWTGLTPIEYRRHGATAV